VPLQPSTAEAAYHLAFEAVGEHDCFGGRRTDCWRALECPALLRQDDVFARRCIHGPFKDVPEAETDPVPRARRGLRSPWALITGYRVATQRNGARAEVAERSCGSVAGGHAVASCRTCREADATRAGRATIRWGTEMTTQQRAPVDGNVRLEGGEIQAPPTGSFLRL